MIEVLGALHATEHDRGTELVETRARCAGKRPSLDRRHGRRHRALRALRIGAGERDGVAPGGPVPVQRRGAAPRAPVAEQPGEGEWQVRVGIERATTVEPDRVDAGIGPPRHGDRRRIGRGRRWRRWRGRHRVMARRCT